MVYLRFDGLFGRVAGGYRVERICESNGIGKDVRLCVFC